MIKYSEYNLYRDGVFIRTINDEELKSFCDSEGILYNSILVTLPDYPNIPRRRKTCYGYSIEGIVEKFNNKDLKLNEIKKNEIDFEKGRIRAEKIIHLDTSNINEIDILKEFNLDVNFWKIEKLNYSLWDAPSKKLGSIPLYSVKCSFKRREKYDYNIDTLKQIIDDRLKINNNDGKLNFNIEKNFNEIDSNTLLLDICDLHLNKYSKDYDIEISKDRYLKSIYSIVNKTNADNCIFVVGEDFFNIDTINKTTTKGTPQDTEVDVYKMFDEGVNLLCNVIEFLSKEFKKVYIVLVQGNHDTLLSYTLVRGLSLLSNVYSNVFFDFEVKKRKYFMIGNSLIGLGHLDTEVKTQKHFLMQYESKKSFGESKYRYFISGHLHNYSVEEIGGITYIRLPSLSGVDNWHNDMGYITSTKGAIGLEFSLEYGLINKIIYNV